MGSESRRQVERWQCVCCSKIDVRNQVSAGSAGNMLCVSLPSIFSAVKQEGCSRLSLGAVWVEMQSNIRGKGAGSALVISNEILMTSLSHIGGIVPVV